MHRFNWSTDNSKLRHDGTVAFSIPALRSADGFQTCRNAGICSAYCYAKQGWFKTVRVHSPMEQNLWKLRGMSSIPGGWLDVAANLVLDLLEGPPWMRQVRIHVAGDFYNESYMNAWIDVARALPSLTFYAYTKMISVYLYKRRTSHIPPNMHIVQSFGGREDNLIDQTLPHSRVFPIREALEQSGYIDCSKSDRPVYKGGIKIGLIYHGNRKLTGAQIVTMNEINKLAER